MYIYTDMYAMSCSLHSCLFSATLTYKKYTKMFINISTDVFIVFFIDINDFIKL